MTLHSSEMAILRAVKDVGVLTIAKITKPSRHCNGFSSEPSMQACNPDYIDRLISAGLLHTAWSGCDKSVSVVLSDEGRACVDNYKPRETSE